jgi:hypothetical protein
MFPTTSSSVGNHQFQRNTIPTEITAIPITQSQLSSSNHDMSQMSGGNLRTSPTPPPNLVRVHHNFKTNYILESYCRPITESFMSPQDVCQFGRHCFPKIRFLSKHPN